MNPQTVVTLKDVFELVGVCVISLLVLVVLVAMSYGFVWLLSKLYPPYK